jgi:hypothetical protein
MAASVVKRLVVCAAVVLAGWIVWQLAGIALPAALRDSDTVALLVLAGLWVLFFGGLGAAQWRAQRALQPDENTAGDESRPRGQR